MESRSKKILELAKKAALKSPKNQDQPSKKIAVWNWFKKAKVDKNVMCVQSSVAKKTLFKPAPKNEEILKPSTSKNTQYSNVPSPSAAGKPDVNIVNKHEGLFIEESIHSAPFIIDNVEYKTVGDQNSRPSTSKNTQYSYVPSPSAAGKPDVSIVNKHEGLFNEESIHSAPFIIDNVEYKTVDDQNSSLLLFDDLSFSLESFEMESSNFKSSTNDHDYCNTGVMSDYSKNDSIDGIILDLVVSEEVVGLQPDTISCSIDCIGPTLMDLVVSEEEVGLQPDNSRDSTDGTILDDSVVSEEVVILQSDTRSARKRKISDDDENKKKHKRSETKHCRMLGKQYIGFKRENRKISHDTERGPRVQKPTCNSNKCKMSKNRHCTSFSEEKRKLIFEQFWKCTWDEKKSYVINMVRKIVKKRETAGTDDSRRNFTLEYYLKSSNENKQVCKTMFLGTLGLNEWMVKNWVDKSDNGLPHKGNADVEYGEEEQENEPKDNREPLKARLNRSSIKKSHLNEWINSLPKMESHYCRKDSTRLYLEGPFNTKQEIYDLYQEKCKDDNVIPLKRNSVMKVFEENKISIFKPRKDQCDTCISYKTKQITDEEYLSHINEKDRAREEKESDKKKSQEGHCIVFTMDLQSVNLCPKTNASSLYYSMKLKVYNLTFFNLGTAQCSTYWWNECEGELGASVFASIVLKHVQNHCIPLPQNCQRIIFYSDGCGYQNRNHFLSNALLNFSIEHNITIEHKYLVKGHSQMECDSAHALIERRVKNRDIYLPSDYVRIAKECKKTKPYYDAVMLDHSYFLDYTEKTALVYKSIRPGKSVGDPAVKDVRALKYNPVKQIIQYKLSFNEDYKELPQRPNKANVTKQIGYKKLYPTQIPLTLSKYNDLQQLKHVLPQDTHSFYDSLPRASKLVKRQKDI